MSGMTVIALGLAAAVLVYLFLALLLPERFL